MSENTTTKPPAINRMDPQWGIHPGPRYFVMHDPLEGWQVVDTETDTHTCHCDRESAAREAKRKEMETDGG